MIDRVDLQDKIREYADGLIIDQIGETEISLFTSKAKNIVEYAFDEYINEQYQLYLTRVHPEMLADYSSFTDGYVSQMKKWVTEHGISLTRVELYNPQEFVQIQETPKFGTPLTIALGGTALAKGVLLLPNVISLPACIATITPIAAIAIEIIALGLAYRAYKKRSTEQDTKVEPEIVSSEEHKKTFEDDLKILKDRLIKEIWSQLDSWLDTAVAASDSLIQKYVS